MTVSEFTEAVRGLLEDSFGDIWLAGEISGCKLSAAGHYYFTLKDDRAQLRCACFRGSARFLKFKPQDGIAVLARGRADFYAERGDLQFIVEALQPQGHGALQLAFEQLKKKLAAEGLFEPSRKRALPKLPRRIGLVTSPTGAVIRDMLNVLSRRFPGLHIRLYPAAVQGEGSVEQVCRGIEWFSRSGWADVVIVARGGGSLEDLWTFNEEAVARAIAGCSVPVISAVGHETDFTIADFAADLRAPTPSAAAELVVCTREQIDEQISNARRKLEQAIRYRLAMSDRSLHAKGADRIAALFHRSMGRRAQRLDELDYRLRRLDVRVRFANARRRIDEAAYALEQIVRLRLPAAHNRLERLRGAIDQRVHLKLAKSTGRLDTLNAHLSQLSPLRILDRGYAIVENEAGHVLKSAGEAPPGSQIDVRLAEGRIRARVL